VTEIIFLASDQSNCVSEEAFCGYSFKQYRIRKTLKGPVVLRETDRKDVKTVESINLK